MSSTRSSRCRRPQGELRGGRLLGLFDQLDTIRSNWPVGGLRENVAVAAPAQSLITERLAPARRSNAAVRGRLKLVDLAWVQSQVDGHGLAGRHRRWADPRRSFRILSALPRTGVRSSSPPLFRRPRRGGCGVRAGQAAHERTLPAALWGANTARLCPFLTPLDTSAPPGDQHGRLQEWPDWFWSSAARQTTITGSLAGLPANPGEGPAPPACGRGRRSAGRHDISRTRHYQPGADMPLGPGRGS